MITEMIKHHLSCEQYGDSGEYTTTCCIDFMIENPTKINVLGKDYFLDRIRMYSSWGGEIVLAVSDGIRIFEHFLIPYPIRIAIIKKIEHEQRNGQLMGWDLAYDLVETLCDLIEERDIDYCFGCNEEMSDNCSCINDFFKGEELE